MNKQTASRLQNLRKLFPSLKVDISLRENPDSNYNTLAVEISNLGTSLGRVEYPFKKDEYSSSEAFKEKVENALESCLDVVGSYDPDSATKVTTMSTKDTDTSVSEVINEAIVKENDSTNKPKEDNKVKVEEAKVEERETDKKSDDKKDNKIQRSPKKEKKSEPTPEEAAAYDILQQFKNEADFFVDAEETPVYESFPIAVRNAYTKVSNDPQSEGKTLGQIYEETPNKIRWLAVTPFKGPKLDELGDDIEAAKVLYEYFMNTSK